MSLIFINSGMTLSIICFYLGYSQRMRNNLFHRIFNSVGIFFNLSTAVYLLLGKYAMGGVESMGIEAIVPPWAVHVHRFFAAISLILMLGMGYTGFMKKIEIHKKLHMSFLVLYSIIYISGMIIFRNIN